MVFQRKKTVEKLEGGKKSVINHMFWCAATTDDNDGDIREAKWLSITNHIKNKHRGHGWQPATCIFQMCSWKIGGVVTGKRNG